MPKIPVRGRSHSHSPVRRLSIDTILTGEDEKHEEGTESETLQQEGTRLPEEVQNKVYCVLHQPMQNHILLKKQTLFCMWGVFVVVVGTASASALKFIKGWTSNNRISSSCTVDCEKARFWHLKPVIH